MNPRMNGMCIRDSGEDASMARTVVGRVVASARIRLLRKELSAPAVPMTSVKFASVRDGSLIAQYGLESSDAKIIQSIGRTKKQPSRTSTTLVARAATETRR